MELIRDYDCIIYYYPRKANIVVNALSWKNNTIISGLIVWENRELLELVQLEAHLMVGMNGSLLARLVVQSVPRKKILDVQKKDEVLEKIRKTV